MNFCTQNHCKHVHLRVHVHAHVHHHTTYIYMYVHKHVLYVATPMHMHRHLYTISAPFLLMKSTIVNSSLGMSRGGGTCSVADSWMEPVGGGSTHCSQDELCESRT